jgi:nitrite reductase/ring-hydroxylating ferredoxin subunit
LGTKKVLPCYQVRGIPFRIDVEATSMADGTGPEGKDREDRRAFLDRSSKVAMAAGLVGGYGSLGAIAIRYLYPARPEELSWQYVARVEEMDLGDAVRYRGPAGETINIARQGRDGTSEDFIALSSTCPHLGCQVRWEGQHNRFFCPCHGGVFDPAGVAIEGPPAEAAQRLSRYPLKVEGGLLHIAVPVRRLANGEPAHGEVLALDGGVEGPGHDPCLAPDVSRGKGTRGA